MRISQLVLIWQMFSLRGDPWPDSRYIGRIHEVVEARNAVAHGNESAGERGRSISNSDMSNRINDIESICTHIVTTFKSQLAHSGHLTH